MERSFQGKKNILVGELRKYFQLAGCIDLVTLNIPLFTLRGTKAWSSPRSHLMMIGLSFPKFGGGREANLSHRKKKIHYVLGGKKPQNP